MTVKIRGTIIMAAALAAALGPAARAGADEGMWLLNRLPAAAIQRDYGFTPAPEWAEHLQKAAVRMGGASASFISPDGLLLTNHHVARAQLAKLSTPEHDYLADGYLAHRPAEELRCPDAVVMTLQEIVDVTGRVRAAAAAAADAASGEAARNAEIAAIERESTEKTGLHSEVVTLYGGGLYHLYRYRRFTDVRVVFAPETAIADFGGDEDNFEFPRFCLDVTLLRVYDDDGRPYRPADYLTMAPRGPEDGEPVFVVGHPGRTQRLDTAADLRFLRDVEYPRQMRRARTREVELAVYSGLGPREKAAAEREYLGVQNWRKGTGAKLRALEDPRVFAAVLDRERRFREAVAANPELQKEVGDAWDRIAAARKVNAAIYDAYTLIEGSTRSALGGSDLFRIARTLVRLPGEKAKPDGERLREYQEARLSGTEYALYSPAPIAADIEIGKVESALAYAAEILGGEDPRVRILLDGKSPAERARELVGGSRLAEVPVRRSLAAGGAAAVAGSGDPMIRLALALEPAARELRARYENEVEAVLHDAYGKLALARFAVYGDGVYPDATGTLRFSAGRVQGYRQEGEAVAPFTGFAGLFARRDARGPLPPFDLPADWLDARSRLAADVPFNFTSTNDIIGGNSGSPVVNRDGEWVGVIFDGNRYSFVWDVLYPENGEGRAVSVDAHGLVEALRTVYGANALADEITGDSARAR